MAAFDTPEVFEFPHKGSNRRCIPPHEHHLKTGLCVAVHVGSGSDGILEGVLKLKESLRAVPDRMVVHDGDRPEDLSLKVLKALLTHEATHKVPQGFGTVGKAFLSQGFVERLKELRFHGNSKTHKMHRHTFPIIPGSRFPGSGHSCYNFL
jgi:hypothetical protein